MRLTLEIGKLLPKRSGGGMAFCRDGLARYCLLVNIRNLLQLCERKTSNHLNHMAHLFEFGRIRFTTTQCI